MAEQSNCQLTLQVKDGGSSSDSFKEVPKFGV